MIWIISKVYICNGYSTKSMQCHSSLWKKEDNRKLKLTTCRSICYFLGVLFNLDICNQRIHPWQSKTTKKQRLDLNKVFWESLSCHNCTCCEYRVFPLMGCSTFLIINHIHQDAKKVWDCPRSDSKTQNTNSQNQILINSTLKSLRRIL